jgi:hypothetical protein
MRLKVEYVFGALSILLAACGGPDVQEQGLPRGSVVRVSVASQTATVDVKNAPLKAVLEELGRPVQITMSVPDELMSELLSLSFKDLPLEEAVDRVLAGRLYTISYREEGERQVLAGVQLFVNRQPVASAGSVSTKSGQVMAQLFTSPGVLASLIPSGLWDPRGRVSNNEQVPPMNKKALSFEDLKRSFGEEKDPALRAEMLEELADREEEGDKSILPILTDAITDQDEMVRAAALNLLQASGAPVPIESLAVMAGTEQNSELRMEAMTLMADQLFLDDRTKEEWVTVKASLNKSLSDTNGEVRDQAAFLLSQLSE